MTQAAALRAESVTVSRGVAAAASGFSAAIYDNTAGVFPMAPDADHRLILMLAPSVVASCRCEDVSQSRRLQVRGDLDIVPAGAEAVWQDEGPASAMLFRLSPRLFQTTAESMDLDLRRLDLQPRLQARDAQIEHIGLALATALGEGRRPDRLYVEGLGLALSARVLRKFASVKDRAAKQQLSRRQLRAVLEHVDANLDRPLTVAELAGVAGISVSHFTVLFRRSTGSPVHRFVVEQRVQRAKTLLRTGDLPISQVALETGFAHQSHLARCMRKVLGVTPREIVRGR